MSGQKWLRVPLLGVYVALTELMRGCDCIQGLTALAKGCHPYGIVPCLVAGGTRRRGLWRRHPAKLLMSGQKWLRVPLPEKGPVALTELMRGCDCIQGLTALAKGCHPYGIVPCLVAGGTRRRGLWRRHPAKLLMSGQKWLRVPLPEKGPVALTALMRGCDCTQGLTALAKGCHPYGIVPAEGSGSCVPSLRQSPMAAEEAAAHPAS
ncbi:MAG: hypothetical protein H6557_22390 [Lewinellaceae bacterium]|nr:hypothetical protein [Lewinellaceae bacterium]